MGAVIDGGLNVPYEGINCIYESNSSAVGA
jgi:hypothetical protein